MADDSPLTNEEFAVLRAAGYEMTGEDGHPDGTVYLYFQRGEMEHRYTRAGWRVFIAGLNKPPIPTLDAAAAAMTLDAVKDAVNAVQAVFEENIGLKKALERAHAVVRAARCYNLRPYGVENGALRAQLDEALAAHDEDEI
jgi:hypothetical protein